MARALAPAGDALPLSHPAGAEDHSRDNHTIGAAPVTVNLNKQFPLAVRLRAARLILRRR
jgi:hypothetical protein